MFYIVSSVSDLELSLHVNICTDAPSIFTDKKYSPAHLETVRSMTSSLDNTIRTCIENSRALNFDNVMWESIFEYGSLTPHNALEIGLVDTTPPVDPMLSLLDENKGEQNSKENDLFLRFGLHESFGKFKAQESVPLVLYKTMLNKREKVESRKKMVNDQLQKLAESSTATSMIFSVFGWKSEDNKKRDKVAVLTVNGTIASTLSYEIVNSLRQIRKDKDVKSVVLRVNSPGGSVTSSEAILEEIKLLDKVCACFDFLTEQTSFLVLISSCAFFVYTSLSFVQCQMQQPVADITSQ